MEMLDRDKLKKTFIGICESLGIKDEVLKIYEKHLEERYAKGRGLGEMLRQDLEVFRRRYTGRGEECLSWFADEVVTDEFVDFVNNNMKYVPVVRYPADSCLADVFRGVEKTVDALKGISAYVYDDKRYCEMMSYLFGQKACLVGSTGFVSAGNVVGLDYMVGDRETYILEDGSVAVVTVNRYAFGNLEDDNAVCEIRMLCPDALPTLDEMDDVIDEDYVDAFFHV